ncbi:AAEL008015-PA [Aedes aegypti]|uniref:AAEL008015-PA n=1 Tax=Aedes aegypti TaxID=7159 RepID=Q16ZY3_AEDAE|nr:AAEL008015-PA [Aedes aegypti]
MDKSGGGDSRDGGPSSSSSSSASSPAPQQTATVPAIGCGSRSSSSSGTSSNTAPMTLNVTTTTGGSFSVLVDGENSVENLKKIISKKLKVSKDRICLLHRERELHDGTLRENGLMDGSKLILTPNVETGLLAQRAENTVMQALESLNDNQVNDFLSGKSPLNLSVRLGDHMMLIQLQLSTLNPSSQSGSRSKTHKSRSLTGGSSSSNAAGTSLIQASSSRSRTSIPIGFRRVAADGSSGSSNRTIVEHVTETQTFTKQELENIHSIVRSAESENPTMAIVRPSAPEPMETEPEVRPSASESPIKSLSNLVSSSINTSNIPVPCNNNSLPVDLPSPCTDPISANLTSCLCKRLDNNDNNSCDTTCSSRAPEPQPSTSNASLHRTAHNPITRHKSKVHSLRKHYSFDSTALEKTELETVQPVASTSAPNSPQRPDQTLVHHSHHHHHHHQHYHQHHHHHHHPSHQSQSQPGPSNASRAISTDPANAENPALAEASRNLTQTLRKLSKRVFTNKVSDAAQEQARNVSSGAVIESMKHHGKGIYSGTFSGTLNPALQDKFGRPKRDISTIIHILNDLLSAAPQCARTGTKIYFEPSQSTSSASTSATNHVTAGTSSSTGSTPTSSTNGSNLQAAALMAPSTLTTPVATPSPRLVSRCVPASIHTKKYPSNSNGTTTTVANLGPSSSCCSGCKPIEPQTNGGATSSALAARCLHHAPKATPKVLCKCGLPLTAAPTASSSSSSAAPSSAPQHCPRCAAAISAAELENSKTKSKLDNLRLIMQQKKERREARKQKCAPYSTAATSTMASSLAASSSPLSAIGVSGTTTAAAAALVTPHHSTFSATATTAEAQPIEETMDTTSALAAGETPATAAAAVAASESTGGNSNSSNSNAANSATATATATTTTTAAATAAATSSEAAQSHQIVEEVDTVA